ncbi:unnamed protein product [Diatraea saccharalis]|uniref:Uncharacterized protein n=1 Tax=Diatraea saccharalis TaxID=40085 RepID=A0A9N9WH71_9NEOP|nr:unnamed protein product [Diatraea saccharalis]
MQSKLLHAMTAVVKSWYSRKDYVTAETILQYPDWSTCKPAMVVLPIFSVQDAPPEKLVPPSTVKVFRDVEERRFDRKPIFPNVSKRLSITNHLLQYNSPKKTSLFSKVPIFDLSKRGDNTYKRSVLPRKDFSSVKNLVNDYINIRRNRFKSQGGFFSTPNYPTNQPNIKSERILNSAEEKVMKTNYYLSNKINSTVSEPILMPDSLSGLEYEKSDIKLMHLLNKLEQEVKHIELDEVKKEIFDAKIRKIYDSVVGPKDFLNRRITDPFETDIVGLEMNENLNTNQNLYSEYENNNHKAKKLHHKIDEFSHKQDNFATNYENSNFDITRENRPLMKNKNALLHNNENNKGNIFGLRRSDPGQEYEIVAKKNLPKNMFRENDILKQRKTYNSNINKLRDIYSNVDIKRRQDMVEKGALNHNDHDDLLSHERRKYYQTILENLERKLRESRNRHHKDHKDNKGRPLRPVRPTVRKEAPLRPLKSQLDPFYMADRARFLHGF